jgi:glycerol-1-phosphatase
MAGFDALLFDLDGVVYVGSEAVPHAAEVITAATARGLACGYVTNNASRSADAVAEHLASLGVPATADDVITSPQAAVSVLSRFVEDGARVLVIGGQGIEHALTDRGYVPVRRLDDDPAAVMQGFAPDLSWRDLAEATFAVRAGLPWIATNPDLTFPTPRGVAPGNGVLVQVVAQTAGRQPDAVAGKPDAGPGGGTDGRPAAGRGGGQARAAPAHRGDPPHGR